MKTDTFPGFEFGTVHQPLADGGHSDAVISRSKGGHYWLTIARFDADGSLQDAGIPSEISMDMATHILIEAGIWPEAMRTYGEVAAPGAGVQRRDVRQRHGRDPI